MEPDPHESLDIAALTRGMVAADENAYRTFYDAYFGRLLRYELVVARGDEDAAQEALQSALVRVVRHIRIFENEPVFWSWLTVVARTALADQGRKHRRYLAFLDRFTERWRIQQALAEPRLPQPEVDLFDQLDKNLAALPYDERDLLERKYFDRQSVRQIATELGLSEKTIESRLVRIRHKLKSALLESLKHE